MPWLILILAGMFEVGFTTCLKLSNNFKHLGWGAGVLVCAILSFVFLNEASKTIPLGTAYAVWTGIGAAGTVLVGIFFFQEPASAIRLGLIAVLVGCVIGLKAVN